MVGDPQFVDAEKGNFNVKEKSPAFQIGFKNFQMDEFGVSSEKLKKIARQPDIPSLITNRKDNVGQTYQWFGASLKNVETLGEQSAAGLPEISGVLLLDVPANSAAAKSNLKVGDVIIECQDVKLANFNHLTQVVKDFQYLTELKLIIRRNQMKEVVLLKIQ